MRKNSKRFMSAVLAMALALPMTTGLTGCGGSQSPADSATGSSTAGVSAAAQEETTKKEPVEITVWSHLVENTEVPALRKVAEEWAAKTGNKVKVLFDATSFQSYTQAANSSKGLDIMYGFANDNLGLFETAKLLDEVPEGIVTSEKYAQGSIDAVTINGKQVAVPIATENMALFYNTEKVQTPPATWDDLVTKAKEVGLMLDLTSLYRVWPFISGKGGYTYKFSNGTYDTNDLGLGEPSKAGYALINSLVNEYKFMKADCNEAISVGNFKNGKIGFYIGGPWDIANFQSQSNLKFAVAPLPKIDGNYMKTFLGVQTAFVNSKSPNKEVAWELVKYLAENSGIPIYQAGNRVPALLADQEKAEFKSNTLLSAFAEQAKVGEPLPNIPEMADTWQSYVDNIKLLITNKIPLDQMVEKMDKEIRQKNKDRNSSATDTSAK